MNAKRVDHLSEELSPRSEPSALRRTFARNLRQAREAAGLTQHAFAKVAACNHRLLANIEVRAANVKLDTITRLANALGLAEIDLLLSDAEISLSGPKRNALAQLPRVAEPSAFRRQFARNLRRIRLETGLRQEALAEAAGMKLAAVSDIEVNAKNVTLDTVTRLAEQLRCREVDLLCPDGEMPSSRN